MSRKWIAGLAALIAVGGVALASGSVLGNGAGPRPAYATVGVDLGASQPAAARRPASAKKAKKPKLLYLQSQTPTTINPAPVSAGGVGPYIDVSLTGCAKVIDGGVVANRLDVYVQGSYVAAKNEYHVLIGLDADKVGDLTPFTITSNLTCLKGAK